MWPWYPAWCHTVKEWATWRKTEAWAAANLQQSDGVKLVPNYKMTSIKKAQFLQNLMESKGTTPCKFLVKCQCFTRYESTGYDNIAIGRGQHCIWWGKNSRNQRFTLTDTTAVLWIREFVDGDTKLQNLKPLLSVDNMVPLSTAECEQAFTATNPIRTNLHSNPRIHILSNIMLNHINRPALQLFKVQKKAETWLLHHGLANNPSSQTVAQWQIKKG